MEEEKNKLDPVPYLAHEAALARAERHNTRLFIALIVAIAVVFVSNALWLWAWMQYDYVNETVTVESAENGDAHYVGNQSNYIQGNGDIYGKDQGQEYLPDTPQRENEGNA